ncbi:MAG TPA: RNA methyltransferase [Terriglobales bacterium]|nr:RNA methyltransferase [Terriglobales bacterium]
MSPNLRKSGQLRTVTSAQNALLKGMRKAFSRSEPVDGHFAVEGFKLIEEAIRSGLKLRAVVFSKSGTVRADRLLPQLSAHTEALQVDDKLFASIVETESPQGVAALVSAKDHKLDSLLAVSEPLLVVAVGLQDPGNLGTIIRSAEAFGATGVVLAEKTVSRFNNKAIRASAGSTFRVPCAVESTEKLIPALREKSIRMLATSSHKGDNIDQAALIGGIALFIGNEGAGLPREVMAQMDGLVTIPQSEKVESLNAGIATSILLYEAARQRRG